MDDEVDVEEVEEEVEEEEEEEEVQDDDEYRARRMERMTQRRVKAEPTDEAGRRTAETRTMMPRKP